MEKYRYKRLLLELVCLTQWPFGCDLNEYLSNYEKNVISSSVWQFDRSGSAFCQQMALVAHHKRKHRIRIKIIYFSNKSLKLMNIHLSLWGHEVMDGKHGRWSWMEWNGMEWIYDSHFFSVAYMRQPQCWWVSVLEWINRHFKRLLLSDKYNLSM